jgi:hypothetical protein
MVDTCSSHHRKVFTMRRNPHPARILHLSFQFRRFVLIDTAIEAKALPLDGDRFAVMHDAAQDGGCEGGIVGEGLGPLLVGPVRGDDDAPR